MLRFMPDLREKMKKYLFTLFFSTLGSIFGSYLYTLIQGPSTGHGWGPTIFFGLLFGTISYFFSRRNQTGRQQITPDTTK